MKLTFILLTATFLQVSAKSLSQNVTISLREVPIVKVFKEIEKQTGYGFLFSKNTIKDLPKITLDVQNAPVSDVLKHCFKDQPLTFSIENNTIIISKQPQYQVTEIGNMLPPPIVVKGRVIDENGNPVEGASIQVKNSNRGTVTNANGEYEIEIPGDIPAIIIISGTGVESQQIAVDGRNVLNITLKHRIMQQEEVVVVGYGTQKKANVTGSISSIKSGSLQNRANTTVGESFAGQIAGVRAQQTSSRPGAELAINIRGVGTISASTSPLYVVDGVPVADLRDFNPNDIESIEVLKDASSSAIYGSRGSNGVVLITTKTGKGKTSISYQTYFGMQEANKLLPVMNRDQFIAFTKYQMDLTYLRSGGDLSTPVSSRPSNYRYPESWLNPSSVPDVNWQKEIFRTAPIQDHQVTASGSSDKGSFLISGGYMKQDGIVKYSDYERANFRLNSSLTINNNLKFGMNIAPSFSTSHNPDDEGKESALHHALNLPPVVGLNSNTEKWGYTEGVLAWPNPIERLKEVKQQTKTNRILTNVWGELNISKSLTLRSLFGYNSQNSRNSYFKPANVNNGAASNGRSDFSDYRDWSLQNTLNYVPSINKHIDLSILLGQGIEGTSYYFSSTSALGYSNDFVTTLNVASTPTGASTFESKTALSSFFGRANFAVNDKYLLNFSIRRDGSSKFGQDKKWGLFPSLSAGWKISEENFLKSVSWIDLLKLRASVGRSGNDKIGDYESISLLEIANYNLNGVLVNGLAPSNIANPDLGWETKVSKVVGIDFNLFRNRLQATFDYYVDDTKDMLLNVNIPYVSGYSSIRQNIGQVQNRGWELELTSHNTTGAIDWSTSFNISRNINEVKKLGPDGSPIYTNTFGSNTYITTIGQPIASFYMYKAVGVLLEKDFDGSGNPLVPIFRGQGVGNVKILDANGDGIINESDKMIVGSNQPKFTWGLTNQLRFKNFDFNILLQGSQGTKVFYAAARHLSTGDAWGANQHSFWTRQWRPANELPLPTNSNVDMTWDNKTPSGMNERFPQFYDQLFLSDASFVRIKNVALGYTLPQGIVKRISLGSIRVYAMADNLYTFTNYVGVNPENNSGGNDRLSPGMDYGSYPISRKYSIGLNVTFR